MFIFELCLVIVTINIYYNQKLQIYIILRIYQQGMCSLLAYFFVKQNLTFLAGEWEFCYIFGGL